MEGAKRKIHRLRNSLSRKLSTSDDIPHSHNSTSDVHPSAITPVSTQQLSTATTKTQVTTTPRDTLASRVLPKNFIDRKARIVQDLSREAGEYNDKSPKGTVDEGVKEIIEVVNGCQGWVSTSSCGGRVSVFVEGLRGRDEEVINGEAKDDNGVEGVDDGDETEVEGEDDDVEGEGKRKIRTGPGGKGGGRWLYVSHDPIDLPSEDEAGNFTKLFGLEPASPASALTLSRAGRPPRLIRLSFSPLILHILSATLAHAKPLLSAAINAGFRESGVQSLKALEDRDVGAVLGIRTAGLVFDSVIGVVVEDENGNEKMQSIVSEEYLKMCVGVINERFEGNEVRRARLLKELAKAREDVITGTAENKEQKRDRKREAGLRKQQEARNGEDGIVEKGAVDDDQLEDGLRGLESG